MKYASIACMFFFITFSYEKRDKKNGVTYLMRLNRKNVAVYNKHDIFIYIENLFISNASKNVDSARKL